MGFAKTCNFRVTSELCLVQCSIAETTCSSGSFVRFRQARVYNQLFEVHLTVRFLSSSVQDVVIMDTPYISTIGKSLIFITLSHSGGSRVTIYIATESPFAADCFTVIDQKRKIAHKCRLQCLITKILDKHFYIVGRASIDNETGQIVFGQFTFGEAVLLCSLEQGSTDGQ